MGDIECLIVSREGGLGGGGGIESLGVRGLLGEMGVEGSSESPTEGAGDNEVAAELGGAATVGLTVSKKTRPGGATGLAVSEESIVVSPYDVTERRLSFGSVSTSGSSRAMKPGVIVGDVTMVVGMLSVCVDISTMTGLGTGGTSSLTNVGSRLLVLEVLRYLVAGRWESSLSPSLPCEEARAECMMVLCDMFANLVRPGDAVSKVASVSRASSKSASVSAAVS